MANEILVALLVGTVMSFFGSMPIAGPVAVLVLERGLIRRGREGLGVALGAAAAETIYAFLAFWGLGAALGSAPAMQRVFRLVGAGLMITLGIYLATRKSTPPLPGTVAPEGRKRHGFLLGLSVTMLNPTIIVTWARPASWPRAFCPRSRLRWVWDWGS
jgi:threonine/homoserine/homoserine lactone efflux protein